MAMKAIAATRFTHSSGIRSPSKDPTRTPIADTAAKANAELIKTVQGFFVCAAHSHCGKLSLIAHLGQKYHAKCGQEH